MHAHRHRNLQLGSHPVCTRYQHRFFPALPIQCKERPKPTDTSENSGGKGFAREMPDALLRVIGDSDVHSCVGVFHLRPPLRSVLSRYSECAACWLITTGT